MSDGKKHLHIEPSPATALREASQLGMRTYQVLLSDITGGRVESNAQLRPDVIARQLNVSTTPVREALSRLENDGLVVKMPYQGWFVRSFAEQEVRDLYRLRAALECFGVRLACENITDAELTWLEQHQSTGESALQAGDMDAYRIYNRDLHSALIRASKNSYLCSIMGQLGLQAEMLMAKTIRLVGRPFRAIEEHSRLISLIRKRDADGAAELMGQHILSALEDIVSLTHGKPRPQRSRGIQTGSMG